MPLHIRQSDNPKFKHLCICEPIDPLIVFLLISNISFIHTDLTRYYANSVDVYKVH